MENVTKVFQVGKRLYIKEELYEAIMYNCQKWWGKEKLSDLWHKKFYKSFNYAEREANKVSALVSKKYDTNITLNYNILQDKDTGKWFLVFEWSDFQKAYGNGTYMFELSDYGHFAV